MDARVMTLAELSEKLTVLAAAAERELNQPLLAKAVLILRDLEGEIERGSVDELYAALRPVWRLLNNKDCRGSSRASLDGLLSELSVVRSLARERIASTHDEAWALESVLDLFQKCLRLASRPGTALRVEVGFARLGLDPAKDALKTRPLFPRAGFHHIDLFHEIIRRRALDRGAKRRRSA